MLIFIVETYVKMLGHALESLGCVSKREANGLACCPFISGQNHGTICNANFGFMCYNNWLFKLVDVQIWAHTFALVINFIINSQWVPYYVIMGLFKTIDTFGIAMVIQVKCRLKTTCHHIIYWTTNCLCEGWKWQSVHPCMNFYFNG
jgi:hypothetical protein